MRLPSVDEKMRYEHSLSTNFIISLMWYSC
jgi:hypothetical protein